MLSHLLRCSPTKKKKIKYKGHTSSASATFNLPSGLEENDVVIVVSASDGTALSNAPAGYTLGQAGEGGGAGSVNARWAYKRMGATPDTQVTMPETLTDGMHLACALGNVDPTLALDVTSPTAATGTTGMPDPPSVTTLTDDAWVLIFGYLDDDLVASSVTAPTGYTLATAVQGGTSGKGSTLMAAYKHKASAGVEDPGAFGGSGTDGWYAATAVWRAPSELMTPPSAAPSIGASLEGGYYAGKVRDKVCEAYGAHTVSTGLKTFILPPGDWPFYAGQVVRIAPGPVNTDLRYLNGTVSNLAGNELTVNITSVTGSGTYTQWVIAAYWKIIVSPKASGETADTNKLKYKIERTADPAACHTLTNGPESTAAMIAANAAAGSVIFPAANFAYTVNSGGGINGYTDWYVPARDELEVVMRNLKPNSYNNFLENSRSNCTGSPFNRDANTNDQSASMGVNRHSDPEGAAYTTTVPGQTSVAIFQDGGSEALTGQLYPFPDTVYRCYWTSTNLDWPDYLYEEYRFRSAFLQFAGNDNLCLCQNGIYKDSNPIELVRLVRRSIA